MRVILIIACIPWLLSCTQRDSITRFSEDNEMDKQYYVYPSTLRMVNLEQKEEFNDLVNDFRKGQFYILSNNTENALLVKELKEDMAKEGYEEAMMFKSGDQDITVYIWERKVPRIAAILESDSTFNIMQVEGLINIAKIPKLLENFDESDYLNVLDIINYNTNEHHSEEHSQD